MGGLLMEFLDDYELIQTLEMAEQIGCDEPFLLLLSKEINRRELQCNLTKKSIPLNPIIPCK
ncbi:sporulation histidine kinase inhibitor Sda [Paenibacillus psychroresistens]|uniref:Sporulation histidine kinase inhibitor Sda n=2 Tax=Paenibacillus psychroresistens TaxID=1778678 RepID=A0A6B8RKF1_9BACL|nr:sporulation histidine kinase inhibitor Sda [Paenibacillus psychroresistens]